MNSGIPPFLRPVPNGSILAVKVLPRGKVTALAGVHGAELKVRVSAPPVDGAANEELLGFLARLLDCGKRQLVLIRGSASQHKLVHIEGIPPEQVASLVGNSAF